jgi:glycosyltransferase EpsD
MIEMKVLYTATSDIHLATFHLPYFKWLKDQGCEVHLAFENRADIAFHDADQVFHLPFPRSPMAVQNIRTYKALKRIIQDGNYQLIHCHTPMPGVLTRLAAIGARRKGTKVLYTAHGFHFFKGAPWKYWLTFFPVEYVLSFITDAIITMNTEDYNHALNLLHPAEVHRIMSIGIDTHRFQPVSEEKRTEVRRMFGYNDGHFLILYTAEFIHRKNHRFIIEALPDLVRKIPSARLLLAGKGILFDEMMGLVRNLKMEEYVHFLGFRTDLAPLAASVNLGISSSRQEGLPLGLAEQMMCGVPVVATVERGHKELVIPGKNRVFIPPK